MQRLSITVQDSVVAGVYCKVAAWVDCFLVFWTHLSRESGKDSGIAALIEWLISSRCNRGICFPSE
jgi:hypothetical protein